MSEKVQVLLGFASEEMCHLKTSPPRTKSGAEEGSYRGKTRCSVPLTEEWFVDRGVLSTRFKVPKYGNVHMLNVALTSVHTRKTSCCVSYVDDNISSACKQVFM